MTDVLPLFFHFDVSQVIGAELNAPERTRNYLMSQQKPSFVNWMSSVQSRLPATLFNNLQKSVIPCSGIFEVCAC